jgi:DNA ligase (NAD+)
VSAKTDYLVVGENPGANKTAGAKKHGTKIITEDELYVVLELDPNNLPSDPLANVNIDEL